MNNKIELIEEAMKALEGSVCDLPPPNELTIQDIESDSYEDRHFNIDSTSITVTYVYLKLKKLLEVIEDE